MEYEVHHAQVVIELKNQVAMAEVYYVWMTSDLKCINLKILMLQLFSYRVF